MVMASGSRLVAGLSQALQSPPVCIAMASACASYAAALHMHMHMTTAGHGADADGAAWPVVVPAPSPSSSSSSWGLPQAHSFSPLPAHRWRGGGSSAAAPADEGGPFVCECPDMVYRRQPWPTYFRHLLSEAAARVGVDLPAAVAGGVAGTGEGAGSVEVVEGPGEGENVEDRLRELVDLKRMCSSI